MDSIGSGVVLYLVVELSNSRTLELTKAEKTETDKERRAVCCGDSSGQFVDANEDSIGKLLMQVASGSC